MDNANIPNVDIVADLEKRFPVEDESYTYVFSKFCMEHIQWRKVPQFIGEVYRILKPGGLAVIITNNLQAQAEEIVRRGKVEIDECCMVFGGQSRVGDFHKSGWSPAYVEKMFREAGFADVNIKPLPTAGGHTDMVTEARKGGANADPIERIKQSEWYRELEAKLEADAHTPTNIPKKLNIGSFTVMIPNWLNLDILDLTDYAKQKGFNFQQVDVRKGLPFEDSSVEQINCSHLLEHFEIETEGVPFLRECYRILKPDGILRLGVPDLKKLVDAYLAGRMDDFYTSVSLPTPAQPKEYLDDSTQAGKFWKLLTTDHRTSFDFPALKTVLERAGFTNIEEVEYNRETDMFPELSIFVVARKEEELYKRYLREEIVEGRQPL